MKRFLFFLFMGTSFVLAENFNKEELTQECMSMLDEFGVADTYFTSKACKSIILEIEDELHYGDSLYPIEQYNGCVTFLKDNHGITDTVTIQKVCPNVAEAMVNEKDSLEKERRKKLMDLCLMLKFSFGASDDSAHYRKICERSTHKSLRHQKARPQAIGFFARAPRAFAEPQKLNFQKFTPRIF